MKVKYRGTFIQILFNNKHSSKACNKDPLIFEEVVSQNAQYIVK
jgi:hypothetical protein